jgi:hypothetical protein
VINFRLVEHYLTHGRQVVEVWDNDEFIATITGQDELHGLCVTSKYFAQGVRAELMEEASGFLAITGLGIVRGDPKTPTVELFIVPPEHRNRKGGS